MSQIYKKGILFGTSGNGVNARHLPANYSPSGYVSTEVSGEGTDKTSAHLKGIDSSLQNVGNTFNGIEDGSKFSFSYVNATRVLTVTYASGAAVWVGGIRYPKSGSDILTAHANTSGKYFIYYNALGTLVISSSPWDLLSTAPLLLVYYNATTVASILIDERHPAFSGMPNAVHKNLHDTRGTQTVSGFAASGYTLNTAGAANLSYAIATGVIADEDLYHTCPTLADGGPYRIIYQSGASAEWTWSDTSTTGILDNGTNLYYNRFTGGAWQLTPITANNTWVNYYVIAVPELTTTKDIIVLMGQTTYASLASAQAEDPSTAISGLGNLSTEFVYLYRMTYRRIAGTPSNAQLVGVQGIRSNTVSISGSFNSSDHQALSNRDVAGSHPATAVSVSTTNFAGLFSGSNTEVQSAFDLLDDITSRSLPANYTAVNYTPTQVASEGTDKTSAHLKGIDAKLATLTTNQINAYTADITYNGTDTTKNVDVTGQVTNAQKCQIALFDSNYERVFATIKATTTTNIQIVTNIALAAGTYRLSVYEDIS